ncbi:MAG: histidine kinase, partial [Bacteroidota bacterium]
HTHNLPLYECKIHYREGSIYSTYGTIHQAIYSFQKGLAVAENNGIKREQLNFCWLLQQAYGTLLDRKRSLAMIYKGLKLAEGMGDQKAVMNSYSAIALYHLTSGEPGKALNIYLRCLKLSKAAGNDFATAGFLLDIGNAYDGMRMRERTVHYFLQIKQYMNAAAGTMYEVQLCCALSSAYRYLEQYDSAYYYAEKAYRIAQRFDDKRILAGALVTYAGIHYSHGNNKAAKSYALRALDIVNATQFTSQRSALTELLKNIYIKENDFANALKIYESGVRFRDSLSNENVRRQAVEKEFEYNLEKKENEYRLLAQQNQIQTLKLNQDRYLFFALGSLILVVLTIAYLFIRQNRFRTEHQRVQLEQKLLRSQMNPHFVFNSLNSIQQFIMSGKNDLAEVYLSKFAKLIRDLLESNIKESLTLQEETEILGAYLEMESLRFGNTFSYSMHTDERIDMDQTNIPHMMIQPFVENAIWHGLLSKTGDRVLRIAFEYYAENAVKCIVDDNGIGREESMKKESTFRKKSLALSFVQQ